MAALRVVLDTNVLVSGLAYPESNPGRILGMWRRGGIDLILSQYIVDEVARVLPRLPHVQLTASEIRDLVDSFVFLADIVEPIQEEEAGLRDAADQQVLGTLRASDASYLVTGDKDLLALSDRYPIITPADFWAKHGV